mgnify:CR=1 FL=1
MVYLYVPFLFSVTLCQMLFYFVDMFGDPICFIIGHAVLNLLDEWVEELI